MLSFFEAKKMQSTLYLFALLGFLLTPINCYSEDGTLVNELENGFCLYKFVKQSVEYVETPYDSFETYMGRCHGAYFRRCVLFRSITKTRMEPQMQEFVENIQKCCDGFVAHDDKCLPFCSTTCMNGNCSAPNTCTCHDGYALETNSTHNCVPQCHGCSKGKCIVPNLCQCNPGYSWEDVSVQCIPFCSGGCRNGDCKAPETCSCHEGYTHHPTESVCIPHCENGCINGDCIGPNECECTTGYEFKNNSRFECEPVCGLSCMNGKCIEPDVCECHSGFVVANETKPHECHCGEYCVEIDDKCHCLEEDHRVSGYLLHINDSRICTRANCLNGFCATWDDCECLEGFEKLDNSTCVAINEKCIDDPVLCNGTSADICDCINGVCAANGTCFCINGFKMSEKWANRCVPQCTKDCVNGICTDIDVCECDEGYRTNQTKWHICDPICNSIEDQYGCINGTCIAPNKCECFEDFELSHESNFTCLLLPESARASRKISHWLSLTGILLAVIAIIGFGTLYYIKHRRNGADIAYAQRDMAHSTYDAETLIPSSEEL